MSENIKERISALADGDLAGQSIQDMVAKMQNYVFPPTMNFLLYDDVTPFAMYIFEFEYELDRDELNYIWQNLAPRTHKRFYTAESTVSHQLFANEIMGYANNLANVSIKDKLQWMVFKVKQKAKTNYFGYRDAINFLGEYNFNLDNKIVYGIDSEFDASRYPKDFSGGDMIKHDEEIISQYSGEKMALRGKPFETLCRSIVGQQISVKAADSVWTKVENLCNGNINKEEIINLSNEEMRSAGLSKQKITYLKNIATSDVLTTNWGELSDAEAIDRLCKIKGVGVWTAEMFLIFNLGRPDVLPLADIGLIRGIEKHYYNSERIDKKELEKNIFVKVRSTGSLLEAKIDLKDNNTANVNLINPEDGISPGQACVFYNKDQYGHKVLGGGWIKD